MASTINSSALPTARCRLLELSAELRNIIYALSFTSDVTPDTVIDITAALAPSPAPILTCKQITTEATPLYAQANADFWASHLFHTDITSCYVEQDIAALRDQDLAHVKRLSLEFAQRECSCGDLACAPRYRATLETPRGTWVLEPIGRSSHQAPVEIGVVFRREGYSGMARELKLAGDDKALREQVEVIRSGELCGPWAGSLKECIAVMLENMNVWYF